MQNNKNRTSVKFYILLAIVVFAIFANNADFLPAVIRDAAGNTFNQLFSSGDFAITTSRILASLFAVAFCMLIATAVFMILSHVEKRNRRMLTISYLVKSLTNWICGIACVIWILSILGIDISAALAGVGIVALVLSFGAQSLVEDVVTGIFIMFEGAFNVGDIIVMDNFRGTVRSIGVRTTIFEDDGGNLKIVNNSDIRNVQNRSRNGSLAVCDVGISYDSSIPAAEKVILDCLEKMWQENDGMYLSHPVYAGVQALADSSVVLRCRVEVREEDIFAAQRRLNRAVKLALDEGGIEIPFPQVVVHQAK